MSSSRGLIKSSCVRIIDDHSIVKMLSGEDVTHPDLSDSFSAVELEQAREDERHECAKVWEERLRSEKKASYDNGLAEGVMSGKTMQREEDRQVLDSLKALIAEMTALRTTLIERAEKNILNLAFAIAEKVIHQEIRQERTIPQSVLRKAILNVTERDGMRIRLNPDDLRVIGEARDVLLQGMEGVKNVLFESDPSITRGGAVIETLFGEVDARLEQQLQEIRLAFDQA